jgi:hypothetical protein
MSKTSGYLVSDVFSFFSVVKARPIERGSLRGFISSAMVCHRLARFKMRRNTPIAMLTIAGPTPCAARHSLGWLVGQKEAVSGDVKQAQRDGLFQTC